MSGVVGVEVADGVCEWVCVRVCSECKSDLAWEMMWAWVNCVCEGERRVDMRKRTTPQGHQSLGGRIEGDQGIGRGFQTTQPKSTLEVACITPRKYRCQVLDSLKAGTQSIPNAPTR